MITYVKVVWDLPPGLEVAQRRSSRRHINGSVGKQSGATEVKTHHRKDKLTTYGEEGNVTDTAQKALYSMDWEGTEQELIDAVYDAETPEIQQHMTVTIVGDAQAARDETNGKPEWGE
jgi:hypothetical protein